MPWFDVVELYRRLPFGYSKATIWNHWELGAHVSSTCRFDNGPQIIGVAWVVGIRISLDRLKTDEVSASPECSVVENWVNWKLDVQISWSSTLYSMLCVHKRLPNENHQDPSRFAS